MFLKPDYNLKSIYDIDLEELKRMESRQSCLIWTVQLWLRNLQLIQMKRILG